MNRRGSLGILGTAFVGLVAGSSGRAEAATGHAGHNDKAHEDCLKACNSCADQLRRDVPQLCWRGCLRQEGTCRGALPRGRLRKFLPTLCVDDRPPESVDGLRLRGVR